MIAVRTKKTAKKNEEIDVVALVGYLNDAESLFGQDLRNAFFRKFKQHITAARMYDPTMHRKRPGGRNVHYDFEICLDDREWKKVEHKGSTKEHIINLTLPPWKEGVQFLNLGMDKISFGKKYATMWYGKFVGSGILKTRFSINAEIPSLDEWIQNDAKVQGKPRTAFSKELKDNFAVQNTTKYESLIPEKNAFAQEFCASCTSEDCEQLKTELLPFVQEALAEKEVWLQVAGNVHTGKFKFAWREPICIQTIEAVRIYATDDVMFEFTCDNKFSFKGKLRWGYGAGFSNIRLDLC